MININNVIVATLAVSSNLGIHASVVIMKCECKSHGSVASFRILLSSSSSLFLFPFLLLLHLCFAHNHIFTYTRYAFHIFHLICINEVNETKPLQTTFAIQYILLVYFTLYRNSLALGGELVSPLSNFMPAKKVSTGEKKKMKIFSSFFFLYFFGAAPI